MMSTRFAVAIAVVCVACVKVSDDVKATFAPGNGTETNNFSPRSPHSIAPPEITSAVVTIPDAGSGAPITVAPGMEGLCARDPNPSATSTDDAGSLTSLPTTGMRNCLQDAGNP